VVFLSRNLTEAAKERIPVAPITERYAGATVDDAYSIQLEQLETRLTAGARLVGHKIGLTSSAMQAQLGIDSPDYGFLMDDMVWNSKEIVPTSRFIQPRIEPEVALILGRDLSDPMVSAADVARSIRAIAPAIEIIDSRIENWRIRLVDTIADNASSAGVVLGSLLPWSGVPDLRTVQCSFEVNGAVVGTGVGAAVMGDPLEAVAWLARLLISRGRCIREGEIVIPGALTAAVTVAAGDVGQASFADVGTVTVVFE
jgi:2-keto-4-pentenoate hydratase